MQQLIAIPLLVFYLFSSLGFHGVSHFCGDQLVEVSLMASDDDEACQEDACCSMPDSEEECCSDVQITLFLESERAFTDVSSRILGKVIHSGVLSRYPEGTTMHVPTEKKHDSVEDSDSLSSVPIYLRHQSLIFYG